MKRFVLALTLVCALSGTALAGLIPTTDVAPPPPPLNETAQPGHIPNTDSTAPGDIPGVDVAVWLTLLSLAF